MRLLREVSMLASLMLLAPACTIVTETGEEVSLEEATEEQYEQIEDKIYNTSLAAGALIQIGLAEDPEKREEISSLAQKLSAQVRNNELGELQSGGVVAWVLSQLEGTLEPKEIAIIQGTARLIDAATDGGIRLELGVELTDRQKGLIVSMLDGLALGVQ